MRPIDAVGENQIFRGKQPRVQIDSAKEEIIHSITEPGFDPEATQFDCRKATARHQGLECEQASAHPGAHFLTIVIGPTARELVGFPKYPSKTTLQWHQSIGQGIAR